MKLLTIDEGRGQPGVILGDDQVLNLSQVPDTVLADGWRPGSVREILERGDDGLEAIRRTVGAAEGDM